VKLYRAYNGWMGYGYTSVLVIAEDEPSARLSAQSAFAQEALNHPGLGATERKLYGEVEDIECLCEDTSVLWAGEVVSA
jgi:hypothetical protein